MNGQITCDFTSFSTAFQLYQLSVISGQLLGDNERQCAMERCLQLERLPLKWDSNLETLVGQRFTIWMFLP